MRAGLLTEEITIQQQTVTQNNDGSNVKQWTTFIVTKAQVDYESGSRAISANEVVFMQNVNFTIRIYHKVTEQMRIIWNSKKYRILFIQSDKQKQSITIKTELINE